MSSTESLVAKLREAADHLLALDSELLIAHTELDVANDWTEHHQNRVDDLIKENSALRQTITEHEDQIEFLIREGTELRKQLETLGGENRRLRQVVAAPAMITWAMHGKDLP